MRVQSQIRAWGTSTVVRLDTIQCAFDLRSDLPRSTIPAVDGINQDFSKLGCCVLYFLARSATRNLVGRWDSRLRATKILEGKVEISRDSMIVQPEFVCGIMGMWSDPLHGQDPHSTMGYRYQGTRIRRWLSPP